MGRNHRVVQGAMPAGLADGRVDPDLTNQYGRTAITCASLNHHDSVVTLLLADGAVSIN